jgi:hypothetical protein
VVGQFLEGLGPVSSNFGLAQKETPAYSRGFEVNNSSLFDPPFRDLECSINIIIQFVANATIVRHRFVNEF